MRILHVITGLRTGGAEKMLLKLATALRAKGAEQKVVSLGGFDDIGPELKNLGFEVEALGMRSVAGLPVALIKARSSVRKFRPDIVQTWLYHADLVGGLAARWAGECRLVWGIRHSDLSWDANKKSTLSVVKLCARLSRRVPHGILCNSARALETHSNVGYDRDRMRVIPNGFATDDFRRRPAGRGKWRSKLGIPEDGILVGWAGRNHPQKSPGDFLRAASILVDRYAQLYFVMVGAGLERGDPALDEITRTIQNKVNLFGPCDEMPEFLSALDIFVSSSIGEGFSNALAEAMCCEVSCVTTDVGDSGTIVGKCGLIARPSDPENLALKIEELILAGDARRAEIGSSARNRVITNWSINAIADQYLVYYQNQLGSNELKQASRGAL